jgi:Putative zinc-finger
MNCPSEGVLRAALDGELGREESERVHQHARTCASCGAQWDELSKRAEHVGNMLRALSTNGGEAAIDVAFAYGRYRDRFGLPATTGKWWGRGVLQVLRPPVLRWVAAGCTLALILSFAPARTWGQKVLQMLRVQKVAVVPIDLSAVTAENGKSGRERLIAQLISDNVVVTLKPGEPANASSAADAARMAGFNVRTLDELGTPRQLLVEQEGAFHMTLDADRMRAVLDQAGRSDIQIPDGVNGTTVAVHIPKSVRLRYGNCPSKESQPVAGDAGASEFKCIEFMQVPSPIVSVPPTLDMAALAEAGLEVTGMSAAEAHAFCQTVDWSSTLVIPIPQNGGSSRTISVDGVSGTLIEMPPRDNFVGRYLLIWVKNGVVYSVGGKGSADRALAAAASLN